MRIAIAGSHSTGKSTLARRLATELSFDLITERARSSARELGFGSPLKVPADKKTLYQWHSLISQISAEERMPNFISDRSTADYLAYWRFHCHADDTDYASIAKLASSKYDIIFLVPPGAPVVEDGARFTNGVQEVDILIRSVFFDWGIWDKVHEITSDGPKQRLAEVLSILKERNLDV